jgi:hypothetical protein
MSDASYTFIGMTDEPSPAQRVENAIRSIDSWSRLIYEAARHTAHNTNNLVARSVGELISSVLLATDDGETILALTGDFQDNAGWLSVVTRTGIVHAAVPSLTFADPRYTVTAYPFTSVTDLEVQAQHNHFVGTHGEPRHDWMKFKVKYSGEPVTFEQDYSARVPLRDRDAVLAAFRAIRDGRSA